jgi:hypothetical protein
LFRFLCAALCAKPFGDVGPWARRQSGQRPYNSML